MQTLDIREAIEVNGVEVRLIPYTEARYERLMKVNEQIDKYVEEFIKENGEDAKFDDMPREKKAEFWYKKARIMWEPKPRTGKDGQPIHLNHDHWDAKENFFTREFFADKNFEYTLLAKTQTFFLNQEFFL